MRVIRTTVCSLTFVLAGALSRDAAAAPPGPLCQEAPAEEVFSTGMKDYSRSRYREAISALSNAVRLCPRPGKPWSVLVYGFGEYPYLPFYFLGKSYYRIQDRPSALRNLYFSACFGEPSRDVDFQSDLHSLTHQCQHELAGSHRPDKHPDFGEGFAALNQKRWQEAAEKMWNALQVWEEDGSTTHSAGRWPDPYLPRFYLATALSELGCDQQACMQLARSKTRELVARGNSWKYGPEKKELKKLDSKCAASARSVQLDSVCQQWQCLFEQEGRQP